MSDITPANAAMASSLIAGGTPFGWAQLAGGVLASANNTPAGPSSSNGLFGSSLTPFDSSGWTVNFGDGATNSAATGDRGGNALTPSNSASGLGMGGISQVYIIGGVLLILLIVTKKKVKP